MKPRPVMLMILDGWGWGAPNAGNAIQLADTQAWDMLMMQYPKAFLTTCGEAVGLPDGTMGNSEVGHLNIGAGRIVYQDLTRINLAIRDGSFFRNDVLVNACQQVAKKGAALHLLGLCSDIGVHSHLDHLDALLTLAKREGVQRVSIHAITDGRDSPPTSGKGYLERVERKAKEMGNAQIATVAGRFYAMDRDKRMERTDKAWRAFVLGEGDHAASAAEVMEQSYAQGVTDEFVVPAVIMREGQPIGTIRDGDSVICFNFRADRMRQMVRALMQRPKLSSLVCMTEYDATFQLPVAFASETLPNIFGEVVARAGLKQLRIAETEKYAHVTYFFNGGNEAPFPGEDRCLIPSPRDVPTYDLKPEMSAHAVTKEVLERIASGTYDVIILNFANPDMVGHTGKVKAAIKAVETVDTCMARIIPAVLHQGGALLITADHGNCEQMIDDKGGPHTFHTLNPVPVVYVAADSAAVKLRDGTLRDLAPTLLAMLDLPQPKEMTGRSLLIS
ncbi:MAG: 2,3-bisphosphoglycerate-independent phosphoglycerate mutase [Deltaproteobacteria bacterium]|nr:2,3-bisphosphoglycerate-independent phosphoglycerate mutase [Deltaproteobacteria bacterium]